MGRAQMRVNMHDICDMIEVTRRQPSKWSFSQI
jgi:hypothetical protein